MTKLCHPATSPAISLGEATATRPHKSKPRKGNNRDLGGVLPKMARAQDIPKPEEVRAFFSKYKKPSS